MDCFVDVLVDFPHQPYQILQAIAVIGKFDSKSLHKMVIAAMKRIATTFYKNV